MSLPAQQIIASPYLAGNPTAPTPPVGDNSESVATTAFVHETFESTALVNTFNGRDGEVGLESADVTGALGFTPVQQGTGISQATNVVKIGWSGSSQLLCTVDSTNLGNFLFGSDYTNLVNDINGNVANLQGQINTLGSDITNNENYVQGQLNNLQAEINALGNAGNTTTLYGIGNYQLIEQGSTGARGALISPLNGQNGTISGGTWMNCGGGQTDNNNWDLWVRVA